MRKRTRICLLVAALAIWGGPVSANINLPIGPELKQAGWQKLTFEGIPASSFVGRDDGVLEIMSDNSSSVLYTAVTGAAPRASRLTWDWNVVDGLPPSDLSKADGDDRVIAIHVVFKSKGLAARMRAMVSPFAAGHVLTYVWGDTTPDAFPHPHLPERGWMTVLRTSDEPHNTWHSESIDLAADFERAFGEPMPDVAYIGISGDADDLATQCFGMVRNIQLM